MVGRDRHHEHGDGWGTLDNGCAQQEKIGGVTDRFETKKSSSGSSAVKCIDHWADDPPCSGAMGPTSM